MPYHMLFPMETTCQFIGVSLTAQCLAQGRSSGDDQGFQWGTCWGVDPGVPMSFSGAGIQCRAPRGRMHSGCKCVWMSSNMTRMSSWLWLFLGVTSWDSVTICNPCYLSAVHPQFFSWSDWSWWNVSIFPRKDKINLTADFCWNKPLLVKSIFFPIIASG